MKIFEKDHPHHTMWRQLTNNLVDGNQPLTLQRFHRGEWLPVKNDYNGFPETCWVESSQYRIKPKQKILVVDGLVFAYPQPFSDTLKFGQEYYTADIIEVEVRTNYTQRAADKHVNMGIVHLTLDAAKEHAEVLKKICKL
jgi:hypothetical protein